MSSVLISKQRPPVVRRAVMSDPFPAATPTARPRLWGYLPEEIHDAWWGLQGVSVVRRGDKRLREGPIYLLTHSNQWTIFDAVKPLAIATSKRNRGRGQLGVAVRIHPGHSGEASAEALVMEAETAVPRLRRLYANGDDLPVVIFTQNRGIAEAWDESDDAPSMPDRLPAAECGVVGSCREIRSVRDAELALCELVRLWDGREVLFPTLRQLRRHAWACQSSAVALTVTIYGDVLIGSNRSVAHPTMVGPAVLWDDPDVPARTAPAVSEHVVALSLPATRPLRARRPYDYVKRTFDIAAAAVGLAVFSPLMLAIAAGVRLEDCGPVLFRQKREGFGGREFACLKFRSMCVDADARVAQIKHLNLSDGPHLHLRTDPRVTRIGRFLRQSKLDELPQFINVLRGEMSLIGPRPSPRGENQFCPAWRDARLSIRPGITGLWQVMHRREEGSDFQQWIRWDMEYVRRYGPWVDAFVFFKTILMLLCPFKGGKWKLRDGGPHETLSGLSTPAGPSDPGVRN